MELNPIDRMMALDCLKEKVDGAYAESREAAEAYLAEKRDEVGATELASPFFGPEAGVFRYARKRAKKAVEYGVADEGELRSWLEGNPGAAVAFAMEDGARFAKWWCESTGELPDGASRAEFERPACLAAPKVYRQDRGAVMAKLAEAGLIGGASAPLLGGGA